jgi:hypothetical protein
MASVSQYNQYNMNGRLLAEASVGSVRPTGKSETRVDTALLISALFLQRFSLPFGDSFLMLDLVPVVFILFYQFLSGKLLIQYDRLLWFLCIVLAATCSLFLNFKSTMLSSYFLFLLLYSLVTLSRPSSSDRYNNTLLAFQFLVMILSCLAVLQFVAQFVVDGKELINFYGIVPDVLFGFFHGGGQTAIREVVEGSSLIKSNAIFLAEPSTLSQVTAIGILIEVLEFRRPRYLLAMGLGFLVAYSGTGLMTLLLFLPLAGLRHGKAGLSVLVVVMFAIGLFATGIIDLSAFLSRASEFEDTRTSGFQRFISPFWLATKQFDTAVLRGLLVGSGPGTTKIFTDAWYGGFPASWFKLFYEYGIIGSFIFVCFLASCLRRSRCPGVVLAALIFTYVFLGSQVLSTSLLTIMIVLCTLSGPEPRRGRIDDASRYQPSFVAGSAVG